ncbi:C-3 sterol dehydrogenase/C-4 decarboxylase-like protein [Zopfia rhizophila CBS 207.26]|uniref:Sterol-4-alpha-carboxylate 3-dehydrogenase ERG26, decarboxylating n=1 Tax=Zopfia rhizophila CBS 207.26 TaxID=1314779 RepID=A0A6A6E8A7_9PEZI|nr:C-3 sterol dehydrogenase/C-4 decarboxylase-like protein [Zopfia rhizophila CBS 207.26]
MSVQGPSPSLGKVLITGGCGFLGHHIVNLLVQRHPATQIAVLDLRTNLNRSSSSTVSYHDGDITDADAIKSLFAQIKPDVVIHTASANLISKNEVHYKVNVEGTQNLLKAAQEAGVKAFVYTSSASVIYNPKIELKNADETWPMVTGDDQPEYYTATKAYAETAVLEANRTPASFLTCAIRPAGIFGEGDVQLLPKMVTAFRKGQTKFQVGDNDNLFDFSYVENIAHGHLLAVQALLHTHKMLPTVPLDTERVDGEVFFLTNGQPVYFWDFARAVWHEAGDRLPLSSVWHLGQDFAFFVGGMLEWIFWILGKTPNLTRQQVKYSTFTRYYSIDKAKRKLGYSPIVDLDEGVRRGVRYILEKEEREKQKKGQ